MTILETERLVLRRLDEDDAPFILKLLNDPSWIENIGDRGVRTIEDAQNYIINSPTAMYESYGFSLFLVKARGQDGDQTKAMGVCGLIKRDTLDDVDLGYAFLPEFWGQGYAYEAASAILDYGRRVHNLSRIVAITLPSNQPCVKLLKKLGFQFEKKVLLEGDSEELELYGFETKALAK